MHHSEYEMRLLAQQRSAELIAEAARLNQLHELRRHRRPRYLRALLARFHRPAPGRTIVDVRERPAAEPAPHPAEAPDAAEATTPAIPTDLRP